MTREHFVRKIETSPAYRASLTKRAAAGTLSEETELLLWELAEGLPVSATVTHASKLRIVTIVDDIVIDRR